VYGYPVTARYYASDFLFDGYIDSRTTSPAYNQIILSQPAIQIFFASANCSGTAYLQLDLAAGTGLPAYNNLIWWGAGGAFQWSGTYIHGINGVAGQSSASRSGGGNGTLSTSICQNQAWQLASAEQLAPVNAITMLQGDDLRVISIR
jgi:hypothetical protein